MKDLKEYKKYYFLEEYLFEEVSKNFKANGCLTPEEFFAIVIWKRNASKTKIRDGIKSSGRTICEITSKISEYKKPEQRLNVLLSPKIPGIGIAFASAILTVCYPDDFTVVDYRAVTSLIKILKNVNDFSIKLSKEEIKAGNSFFEGNPSNSPKAYLKYCEICKIERKKINVSLRDFDRILWAVDFYEGEDGLKDFVRGFS